MIQINITEEQKAVIEEHGYMVIEFKLWCKKGIEKITDAWNAITFWLLDIKERVVIPFIKVLNGIFDRIKKGVYQILEEPTIEPKHKYNICKKIGIDYKPYIKRSQIYYCRNNC